MSGFTTFRGTLKRLALDEEAEPARCSAFQWAFPGFLDPPIEFSGAHQSEGTALPFIRRRRYSGGLFSATKPLPRGRYSTVCVNQDGDDLWGLCQELRSYQGSTFRQKIFVYDMGSSQYQEFFKQKGWLTGNRLGLHFVDEDGAMLSRYASIGDSFQMNAEHPGFWRTYLDYFLEDVTMENVVDLRLPSTQQWFFETFKEGYGDFWIKPAGQNLNRFEEMLPTLMTDDLGGSQVTDAIGYALRMMGTAALIYPSARCNPETVIDNGELTGWTGFNLVDLRGYEILQKEISSTLQFNDTESWHAAMRWPDLRLEIAEISEDKSLAERWKGSWRLLGNREAHEQFWEEGGILGGREVGEWEDQEINHSGDFAKNLNQLLQATAQKKQL